MMPAYEQLGAMYLGRACTADAEPGDDVILYDSKDLTTHAVCVGMTGSGKTGLCLSLLEEAGIDGIPAIVIDPKGDLGNLLLTFPELRPNDFRPWIDPGEAQRKGMTLDEYAANRAALWRKGLKKWDQDGERIRRFRSAADVSIYTPGSEAGLPLAVFRSFAAPPAAMRNDADAMRERVTSTVSGLLDLLGLDTDPMRSRDHILLSLILDRAWRDGRALDFTQLIGEIQTPPFERVGVMDLESFYPARQRFSLAMAVNTLIASPMFAAWTQGEPLDIDRLLYTREGRPRISIVSIAHLSEKERMFFVSLLLNEVVAWTRSQSGTSSLRAILYMDEVFGYFPPVAEPPSKRPMLTLLKQARAYGLGIVMATQNPADLDYKGLSNIGTWFLGRLQTERDKARVLDGLEGASAATGSAFDRASVDRLLSGLRSRVFLMNNVHDDEPTLFHTRWALSYLRGPLTRDHIKTLTDPMRDAHAAKPPAHTETHQRVRTPVESSLSPTNADGAPAVGNTSASRPLVPPAVAQGFLPIVRSIPSDDHLVYRPALLASGRLHYVRVAAHIDDWRDESLLVLLEDSPARDLWPSAETIPVSLDDLDDEPDSRGGFAAVPSEISQTQPMRSWSKAFKDYLYRERALPLWMCQLPKLYSELGEEERTFRIRVRDELRERRDTVVEKLRKKYTPKLDRLKDRIRRAEQKIEVEKAQYHQAGLQTAVNIGSTVLGALFGRRSTSRGASAMKSAGRTAQQRGDVGRAKENVESLRAQLVKLEDEFNAETKASESIADVEQADLKKITVRPRKGDIAASDIMLAWVPFRVTATGEKIPVYEHSSQSD